MCVCVRVVWSQLPSSADVCLLSGVLCLHEWLRRVSLDGNPIDEDGLGFLCRALLKNGSIQSVSLNRYVRLHAEPYPLSELCDVHGGHALCALWTCEALARVILRYSVLVSRTRKMAGTLTLTLLRERAPMKYIPGTSFLGSFPAAATAAA